MLPAPRRRSWLEVRLRQARNPPLPVLRAVLADLAVASLGGLLLVLYDLSLARGLDAPANDLRGPLTALYVAVVVIVGSSLTWLWVELPSGATGRRRRTPWAALLGFFAALPISYLVLVVAFDIVRPLLGV
ncbi:MAG: hypothetical protein H0V36_06280 [Chloroflexi bacterium]|nr:hypothetical protein [Chloroflexota bacterium]